MRLQEKPALIAARPKRGHASQPERPPQQVANAALFLASDESSFITCDRMICASGRYM